MGGGNNTMVYTSNRFLFSPRCVTVLGIASRAGCVWPRWIVDDQYSMLITELVTWWPAVFWVTQFNSACVIRWHTETFCDQMTKSKVGQFENVLSLGVPVGVSTPQTGHPWHFVKGGATVDHIKHAYFPLPVYTTASWMSIYPHRLPAD